MSNLKKFIFSFILFIISVTIFFLIGEMFFRIFKGPPNQLSKIIQTDYSTLLKPNTTDINKSSVEGEFEYTIKINNHGYRGVNFDTPKPNDTKRIFIVGDSFTFGVGSQENETIPYLVQETLKQANPNIEVINAGIGHTGPAKHYINLKNIHLQHKPDMVLLLFDLTDLRDDWHTERHGVYDKNGELINFNEVYVNGQRHWWLTAMKHSSFCVWINRKIVRSFRKIAHIGLKEYFRAIKEGKKVKALIANAENTQDVKIEYDGLLMMRGQKEKELIDHHFKRTAKYLDKIKDLLAKNNIKFMIGMYPHGIYVSETQWANGRASWGFEENKQYTDYYGFELVENYARENNIPFINILDDFLVAEDKKYFFDYDGHLTPEGNIIVADSITQDEIFLSTLDQL